MKKIWEIELKALESKKTKEFWDVLKETNKLLKKVGSKTQFIEKEKDLAYIVENIWKSLKDFFIENFKSTKKKKEEIDKESYYYLKNEWLLKRYKDLEKELNIEKIKNFHKFIFTFNQNYLDFITRYNIKKALVIQNITLLEAKISNKSFSYTKIVNTYEKWLNNLLEIFNTLKNSLFYFIFLYSLFFLVFINLFNYLNIEYTLNLATLKYIILLIIFYFFFLLSKKILSIIFNAIFFSFIIIIYLVNF